jgi:hypothetical protein
MYFNIALPFLKEKKLGLFERPDAIINGQSTPPKRVAVVFSLFILSK